MKTKSLSDEVLYYMGTSHTIKNTLDTFGINHVQKAFMVLQINTSNEIKVHVKQ